MNSMILSRRALKSNDLRASRISCITFHLTLEKFVFGFSDELKKIDVQNPVEIIHDFLNLNKELVKINSELVKHFDSPHIKF